MLPNALHWVVGYPGSPYQGTMCCARFQQVSDGILARTQLGYGQAAAAVIMTVVQRDAYHAVLQAGVLGGCTQKVDNAPARVQEVQARLFPADN
jgi:hypothetical protein